MTVSEFEIIAHFLTSDDVVNTLAVAAVGIGILKWLYSRERDRVDGEIQTVKDWAKEKVDDLDKKFNKLENMFYSFLLPNPVKLHDEQQ